MQADTNAVLGLSVGLKKIAQANTGFGSNAESTTKLIKEALGEDYQIQKLAVSEVFFDLMHSFDPSYPNFIGASEATRIFTDLFELTPEDLTEIISRTTRK